MKRKDLEILKNTFFTSHNIPMFLLREDFTILSQTDGFMLLPINFFQNIYPNGQDEKFSFLFLEQEIYITFKLPVAQCQVHFVCIGPIVLDLPSHLTNLDSFSLFNYGNVLKDNDVLRQLPRIDCQLYQYIQLLYGLIYQELLSEEQFNFHFSATRTLKYSNNFFDNVFKQREEAPHGKYSYDIEVLMLEAIRKGDGVFARIHASKLVGGRIGKMSEDELRNKKYALIAGISIVARTSIDAGVNVENAYALSDVYIKKVDEGYNVKVLLDIFYDMIADFCRLVQLSKYQNYPMWIRACVQHIDQNLHTNISLSDLSKIVHMAPSYVSVQFKKIVGKSIVYYSNEQRIYEARVLLKTTDMSIQEIASTLNFGTQSYFTKVFKSITGSLPRQYRDKRASKK